jgi:phage baseplate assembly protein W
MVELLDWENFMKSIQIPFSFVGGKTSETTNISKIINQKIENVLNTQKLERILHPGYGSTIISLINEVPDELMLVDAKVDALMDLEDGITNATILDMVFDASSITSADPTLNVYVTYSLPLGVVQRSNLKIAIPGLITEDTIV